MLKKIYSVKSLAREVRDFLSPYIDVERIIIFGSYAQGKSRSDSDIDIAVISKDFEKMRLLEKIYLLARVPVSIDSRIEMIGFSYKDFQHPPQASLLDMIKRKGKVII